MISSKPPFALSNEEQIWTCLYRKQREEEIKKEKGRRGNRETNGKEEKKEKGKGKKERGKKENNPHLIDPLFIFLLPNDLTKKI